MLESQPEGVEVAKNGTGWGRGGGAGESEVLPV